jgi:peptide/nickel transport system permease protein
VFGALPLLLGGLLVVLAVGAPWLAPYSSTALSGTPLQQPGAAHLLGTDDLGYDLWSQWLWGARSSLAVGAAVALLSAALAWSIGLIAGVSSRAEPVLVGTADLLLALPSIPLYLLVLLLAGPGEVQLVLVLALLGWPTFARIVRAQVLSVRSAPYVEAARCLGASPTRVAVRHILPATVPLLPPKLILTVRYALFAQATLAFLGLADPANPSWGKTLGRAFGDPFLFSRSTWGWWVLPPAAAIVATVLLVTWLAEHVRTGPQLQAAREAPGEEHVLNSAAWSIRASSTASRVISPASGRSRRSTPTRTYRAAPAGPSPS